MSYKCFQVYFVQFSWMCGEMKPESRIIFRRLRRRLQFGLADFFSADFRLRHKIRRRRPNSAAQGSTVNASVCHSVCACIPACVPKRLSVRYLRTQWREFHQTLTDDVVKAENELVRFWKSMGQGQGRYKVRCEKLGTHFLSRQWFNIHFTNTRPCSGSS